MRRVAFLGQTAFLKEEVSCYNCVVFDFFLWCELVYSFDRSCASIYNNRTNDELNPAVFLRVLWIPLLLSITASSEIANFIESIKQRQLLHKWLKKTGCCLDVDVRCRLWTLTHRRDFDFDLHHQALKSKIPRSLPLASILIPCVCTNASWQLYISERSWIPQHHQRTSFKIISQIWWKFDRFWKIKFTLMFQNLLYSIIVDIKLLSFL